MMKNMEVWEENINKATNKRMLEQMTLHAPQTIKATSTRFESMRVVFSSGSPYKEVIEDSAYFVETPTFIRQGSISFFSGLVQSRTKEQ